MWILDWQNMQLILYSHIQNHVKDSCITNRTQYSQYSQYGIATFHTNWFRDNQNVNTDISWKSHTSMLCYLLNKCLDKAFIWLYILWNMELWISKKKEKKNVCKRFRFKLFYACTGFLKYLSIFVHICGHF